MDGYSPHLFCFTSKQINLIYVGDHVSGQSVVKTTTELLGEYLTKNLDDNIGGKKKLSFLFKVLSIRKALSIQCHPSKVCKYFLSMCDLNIKGKNFRRKLNDFMPLVQISTRIPTTSQSWQLPFPHFKLCAGFVHIKRFTIY